VSRGARAPARAPRRPAPGGPPSRPRLVVPVAAAGVAVAIAVATIVVLSRRHGAPAGSSGGTTTLAGAAQREHDAAVKWIGDVEDGFGPGFTETVTALLTGAPDWERGALSTADYSGRVGLALAQLVGARDRMIALAGFPPSPLVKDLTVRSTELSVEMARIYRVAVGLAPGDVRLQLDLEARRLQQLATRVFDRAQAIVQPYLHQPSAAETVAPADVPSWDTTGLAPGPPLDPRPAAAAGPPPTRQASRPAEPRARWLAKVRSLDVPGGDQVAAALAIGDTGSLRRLADGLQRAADALGPEPDPSGSSGREESARFRLLLLVRAEAAREAALAALAGSGPEVPLAAGARRLVLLSDGMDPPELAVRPSGLDRGLLTAND
jgi:hypothetical protein